MNNNPYRKGSQGSSPTRNPMVLLGGGVLVLIFILFSSFSGSSDNELKTGGEPTSIHKLRSPNNAEKEQKIPPSEKMETNKEDIIEEQPEAPDVQEKLKLQQEIVHEEKKNRNDEPGVHVEAMEDYNFENVTYFHRYTGGKSGAVIEDMLMAHAYAFHMNGVYGGCCADGEYVVKHVELLDALGLKEALPFACPHDYPREGKQKVMKTIGLDSYHTEDTRIWTPAYVAYLKSLVKYPKKNEDEFVIVAHIRRGDVTPCRPKTLGYDRYLPNKHFMDVIDLYNKPGARVEIISESNSFESLDEFREKGYIVNLDEDLGEIWRTFISADVVILSRSDFSMIPAVCAMGQVVYTPFWHPPIRGWERVSKDIMIETDAETQRLREERC